MRTFFRLYQYWGPALLTPLAYWLWRRRCVGDASLAWIAVAVPIVYAYVVPGVGTNVLKMWAFNTRLKIGRFRPQHGFVFGSATALLTLLAIGPPDIPPTGAQVAFAGLRVGALLLAVNWIYDALAIRAGFLEVYNQPWSDGAGPWSIAADYVVWFFGLFGVILGAGLRYSEGALAAEPSATSAWALGTALLAAELTLPAAGYALASRLARGHWGCRPFRRSEEGTT